jgi:nucleotide-binding universal stress UspA family protein
MSEPACRVLLPVDGSEHSIRAVRFLIKLYPKLAPLDVHLLHVLVPAILSSDKAVVDGSAGPRTAAAEALDPAKAMLDLAAIPYTSEVQRGYVGSSVVAYAKANRCDGIVMGTRGMGTTEQLLGSTARQVLLLADVPVTLVR